ncbi:hypothetical protein ACFO0M_28170 [Micromonospora mangrovi]|uniref:DUF3592 domain-containing protein n=2 Tax=Micromonospora TaxID=1873 RepID=A0AAU7ME57_9ACTN
MSRGRRVVTVVLVAAVAVAGYLAGLVPGDSARAAVDHCHVTYDRQERQHSRCVGHWTRLGHVASGPVHGVRVSPRWQARTLDPDANFEWEVDVPTAARHPVVVAVPGRAYVVPTVVRVLLTVLVLVALAGLGGTLVRRRRPGSRAERPATG